MESPSETANKVLNPVTQKVIERCITEIIGGYVKENKYFTADSIHYIRSKVTELAKERLGDDEVTSIDVGLDLTSLEDIPFFFRVNIPKEKIETHILSSVEDDEETFEEEPAVGEAEDVTSVPEEKENLTEG